MIQRTIALSVMLLTLVGSLPSGLFLLTLVVPACLARGSPWLSRDSCDSCPSPAPSASPSPSTTFAHTPPRPSPRINSSNMWLNGPWPMSWSSPAISTQSTSASSISSSCRCTVRRWRTIVPARCAVPIECSLRVCTADG